MGSFVCKQPNGKYCRFSTVVDTVTDYDMTEEHYVELCKEKAEEEAWDVLKNHLKPFSMGKQYFSPTNDTVSNFNSYLKKVGDTEQLDELNDEIE